MQILTPPEEWTKKKTPIDVMARREEVFRNVSQDGKRKIYKIEAAKGFSGGKDKKAACIYFSGCSFMCQYCFVNPQSLTGAKGEFMSAYEAFLKLRRIILQTKNPQVQFNGGEVFLTPEWTVELVRLLSEFFDNDCPFVSKKHPGRIWCDTMGFDLQREPQVFKALEPYRKHVALFISTKGHPKDYEVVTRTPAMFADEPFLALETAWKHGLVAMPEVLDRICWPQRMDWYIERLQAIHPNAPRVLHFDRYSPITYVKWSPDKRLKMIGAIPNKNDPERNLPLYEEVIVEWQKRLKAVYGARVSDSSTFNCDTDPDESFRMVETLILDQKSKLKGRSK